VLEKFLRHFSKRMYYSDCCAQSNFYSFVEENPPSVSNLPSSNATTEKHWYIAQIRGMPHAELSTLYVDFQHLMTSNDGVLATAVANNYYRFLPFLTRALYDTIAKYEPEYFREHRQPGTSSTSQNGSSVRAGASSSESSNGLKSVSTDKLFTLAFYNLPLISRIRQLRSESVGHLLSISGTVTRTSEVRPELYMATFICENCQSVVANVEQIFKYTEPTQCPNLTCMNRTGWQLDIRQSTFVDWQKVRIQENSSEIPTGSMPRTMDVILRGEIVDRAKAGEKCVFTGSLIVVPDVSQLGLPGVRPEASRDNRNAPRGGDAGGSGVTGLKALGVRDLTYRLAFLACMVNPDTSTPGQPTNHHLVGQAGNILASLNQLDPHDPMAAGNEAQEEYLQSLTPAEIEDLKMMVHSDHIYSRLVNSLAPMVYGHEIIKKGLLLQLMGGVSKSTKEGLQLRGDINIAIVGDPSTSKSQFLKLVPLS
jgi:DNA replication licensing factor MCM6